MAEVLGWTPVVATDLAAFEDRMPDAEAVVVLTHHEDLDGPALAAALETDVVYIGAMGSRRTQERRRAWLVEHGVDEAAQQRVHGPAGLDIGADSPGEIALAILAELVSVVRGHHASGGLRDKAGPIHPELEPGAAYCPGS